MKKSLLALAVLGAFAGAASAQSSVTLYGKLDLGFAKAAGSADKQVADGSGSRVGFRGVEDLGGGLKALFQFEHRFNPDTGTVTNTAFWHGLSTVGLGGSFGTVNLGRQYTAAFSLITNVIDPFGGDTVAGLRGESLTKSVARLRTDNSVRYDGAFGGLKVAADIAETPAGGVDRPYSVAAQYAAGPFMVAASYDNPTGANDNLATLGGSYTFGPAKVSLGIGRGDNNSNVRVKQALAGVTVSVGAAGQVLAGYAQEEVGTADATKKVSLGYRHNLSKRTQLYTDVTRVNDLLSKTEKTGYDFGVIHTF
ncbi:putative porin [Sphaerotilus sulfidivorans]|uniref:Porin n=1 Tax=Sphaerotilus sulfidivorans TaxID=639200 RepID=A0A5C1Q2I0_9BURK|nr:porin [Sphaerotilus sulfidivorans]NZD45899.1 porin [Sphaerotilus sulfidivorans]QEN01751.1 porin [Sphaerotilus sulfidivorans]